MFGIHVLCRLHGELVGCREVPTHRSGDPFDARRDPLTAADAEGRQAVTLLALAELVREREREPRARRTERMPERDRAAVHIRLLPIEAEVLLDREVLRRESLVDLGQVHVLDFQPGALERLAR